MFAPSADMSIATFLTTPYLILEAIALLLAIRAVVRRNAIPQGLRLPPGPPGKPLVGNVTDMPTHHEWETYTRWAKEYGAMVYLKVLRQPMVFINSVDVAYDLFEKRSSIYSDRVEYPMMNDLMGFHWNFAFQRYGDWWRRHRKLFHQKFHPTASTAYCPIQTSQTRTMLRRLQETPDEYLEHIRLTAGAIIMEIVYGIKVLPKNDPYIDMAERAMLGLSEAASAGTFLVDVIPILKYVPEWMPGASFRKKARIWREATTAMSVVPFSAVKEALNAGTARPSVILSMLEEASLKDNVPPDEEEVIRNTGSTAYLGGADTTVSALHTFFLAMVLYPEVQKKAQEELDSVIGPDRLPEFDDRDSLPYINALCKEVIRWQPVVPLTVGHRVTQDDVYGDYFIPKGTLVVGSAWTMLHDESMYGSETEKFKPERFLVPGGRRDPTMTFGFGRRMCPGRYLADNSVFIGVSSILKVFNISHARDSNGAEIPVEPSFTSGFISHPEIFRCAIIPRSSSAERLLSFLE